MSERSGCRDTWSRPVAIVLARQSAERLRHGKTATATTPGGVLVAGGILLLVLLLPFMRQGHEPHTLNVDHAHPGGLHASLVGEAGYSNPAPVDPRLEMIRRYVSNPSDVCLEAGAYDRSTEQKAGLTRLFSILARSAVALDLLRQARTRDVYVCLDNGTPLLAFYYADARIVGLRAQLSEGRRVVFLAHELAHVVQHPTYSDDRGFAPTEMLLLRRIREAAAEAAATRVVWQLRKRGYPLPWYEKKATVYGDIAGAFEGAVRRDPSPDGEVQATRIAFDQWFAAPWRLGVYDRMTIERVRRILTEAAGAGPSDRELTYDLVQGIAWLDGRNYMAETEGMALDDPLYRGSLPRMGADLLEHALGRNDGPAELRKSTRTPRLCRTTRPEHVEIHPPLHGKL